MLAYVTQAGLRSASWYRREAASSAPSRPTKALVAIISGLRNGLLRPVEYVMISSQ